MDWRSCKYYFSVSPQEMGLQAKDMYLFINHDILGILALERWCGQLGAFQTILSSSSTAANIGHLSWKDEGSIHTPSNCSWRCRSSAALESRLVMEEKHFKIRFCVWWCPWWKQSLLSILILKKKRELKKTQTIPKSCSTLHAGF